MWRSIRQGRILQGCSGQRQEKMRSLGGITPAAACWFRSSSVPQGHPLGWWLILTCHCHSFSLHSYRWRETLSHFTDEGLRPQTFCSSWAAELGFWLKVRALPTTFTFLLSPAPRERTPSLFPLANWALATFIHLSLCSSAGRLPPLSSFHTNTGAQF